MDDVEGAFRAAYGQAVATLTRVFGDISLAEDAVQDAFVTALDRWPRDGVPDNPAGWIVATARNRAIDVVRRSRRGRELTKGIASDRLRHGSTVDLETDVLRDDQLRLVFTCCHPALRVEHQVALTLRLIAGLTPTEVASAFLVSEDTMAKRLVRAKYKIKAAHIPYRVPEDDELPDRLRPVLAVLYLVYNAGSDNAARRDLRAEAIHLTRLLAALMPDEPEVSGLLALMLLSDARVPARSDDDGVVLLKDQDRSRWDHTLIAEGQALVLSCLRLRRLGPFQLQAAIQALHCAAGRYEDTDWAAILRFYDRLLAVMPTPIVALNRAVAVVEIQGPSAGLALLDEIADELATYHLLHAARGSMLHRLGRRDEAADEYARAANLATTKPEIQFLRRQSETIRRDG
ncbi:sigma-70 family RNA polymerase sigma factor [Kribbella sp. NBC_00709]|uniref:RNA polymerase sigma factor n=1 Tax=Kribbella sp. NBC_00709 TaxID=2975972 RepID=UPI002E2E10CB|nr:sigma-70 family RNA polymerase sigma factor [Kribbella sp. NBC_00709]